MKKFKYNKGVMKFQNFEEFRKSLRFMTKRGKSPITDDELDRIWNGEELIIHFGVGPTKIKETNPNSETYIVF